MYHNFGWASVFCLRERQVNICKDTPTLDSNKKSPNPHPASLRSSNDPERSPSLIKHISRRTWHTPNPRWPVRKSATQPARPIPSLPHLLPFREHLLHIDRSPAQRLLLKVRVDVRGGLVVGVAHNLHGDQRVDATLVEQCHVVVPEIVRGQRGLDLLKDVVRARGARLDLPPCHTAAGHHQPRPHALVAGLRKRRSRRRVEYVSIR